MLAEVQGLELLVVRGSTVVVLVVHVGGGHQRLLHSIHACSRVKGVGVGVGVDSNILLLERVFERVRIGCVRGCVLEGEWI